MKALVGAFNQEKALVGAFSVIVQPVVELMDRFTALVLVPEHGGGPHEVAQVEAGAEHHHHPDHAVRPALTVHEVADPVDRGLLSHTIR